MTGEIPPPTPPPTPTPTPTPIPTPTRDEQLRYLENVVLPLHLEHVRARSSGTNTFLAAEGAAFALGGTFLPARLDFVNLALPVFALLAAVSLLLWDARNRQMIAMYLQAARGIEALVRPEGEIAVLSKNLETLDDSRLPTRSGIVSHTWSIRILAYGSIAFWCAFLVQKLHG